MTSDYLVSFPGLGIIDLPLNRVAFTVFGVDVYWYGLLIALAAVICIVLSSREAEKFNLDPDFVTDNFLVLLPSMIIGARIYYVAFSWDMYKDNLLSIFDTRKGGLAFYGGVIGGFLGVLIFHKIKKQKLEPFVDFISVYIPLGQAIGRIGNFVNQEAFGTNTSLPWGMISNGTKEYLAAHPELGQDPNLPVHPTFLYEFVGNMLLFAILHRFRKNNKIPYGTTALYLLGYGIIRFFVEGIRTDSLYIGNTDIRASQLLSLLMVICAVIYLIALRKKKRAAVKSADDALFEAALSKRQAEENAAMSEPAVSESTASESAAAAEAPEENTSAAAEAAKEKPEAEDSGTEPAAEPEEDRTESPAEDAGPAEAESSAEESPEEESGPAEEESPAEEKQKD